jgi:pyridoxal phosphate enzyme (YggS family)
MDNINIKNNLNKIKCQIQKAAQKSGTNPDDIVIIAVTKNVSIENMKKVLEENIFNFAENKVQELLKKYDIFNERCIWHFIGRLQTNKVKYIVDKVSLIHSVDRIELIQEIDKRVASIGKPMDVLIQVNISGELTKAGVEKKDLHKFILEASKFENIRIKGLMTMAPHFEDVEKSRCIFRELKELAIDIKRESIHNVSIDFLSMGMSDDFGIAIEEGSNIVRLGSAIFT